jgi:hypothetical protein
MRVVGILVFGLLASAIIGGLLADRLEDGVGIGLYFGVFVGMFSFACIRLWLAGS